MYSEIIPCEMYSNGQGIHKEISMSYIKKKTKTGKLKQ